MGTNSKGIGRVGLIAFFDEEFDCFLGGCVGGEGNSRGGGRGGGRLCRLLCDMSELDHVCEWGAGRGDFFALFLIGVALREELE